MFKRMSYRRQQPNRGMKNTNKLLLIPIFLFIAAVLTAHWLRLWQIVIPIDYIQLLDVNELKNHPFDSLLYLHSQPPLLNALLACILNLSDFLHIGDVTIVKCLFLTGGLIGAILFFLVLRRLTDSAVMAALGLLILLTNPAYHFFGGIFFYPFILQILFLILFWLIAEYMERDKPAYLFLIVFLAATITNTRTLFHPAWAICLCLIVVAGKRRTSSETGGKEWRRYVFGFLLLALLLSVWPLKNFLVFGQFTYSSLTGFNLAHHLPIEHVATAEESLTETSDKVNQYFDAFQPVFKDDSLKVLTDMKKSDGSMNWNHISFLLSNKDLKRLAIRWRLKYPDIYFKTTLVHYLIWCSPSSRHPYDLRILGPRNPVYLGYVEIYNKLLTVDIRRFVEGATPNLLFHEAAYVRSRPVRYTIYGLIFFPILLVATVVFVALNLKKRRPPEAIVLACMFCHIFAMIVVCLTDGQEGARMSFSTLPAVIIMAGYTINEAATAVRSRTGRSNEKSAAVCHSEERRLADPRVADPSDADPSDADPNEG